MKTLKFGLIGVGYFGKNFARTLLQTQRANLVVASCKTKKSIKSLNSFLPKRIIKTNDSNSIFEDPLIDCVIIATPASTHFKLAKKAIESGKHVLLEKPMVKNFNEAKKLLKIVKKNKSTFMVGHQYLYNNYVEYIKEKISKNYLGKIKHAFSYHHYIGSRVEDIGCLWDAVTHQLSVLQYLFEPKEIINVTGKSVNLNENGYDDYFTAKIEFENKLIASMLVSRISNYKMRNFIFSGDKKTAFFNDYAKNHKLEFYSNKFPYKINKINLNATETLQNEVDHFIYCVNNNKTPRTNIENSFIISKWLEKISKSLKIKT